MTEWYEKFPKQCCVRIEVRGSDPKRNWTIEGPLTHDEEEAIRKIAFRLGSQKAQVET